VTDADFEADLLAFRKMEKAEHQSHQFIMGGIMKGAPERIWLTPDTNIAAPGKHTTGQVAYRREDVAMYYREEFYRIERVLMDVRGAAEARLKEDVGMLMDAGGRKMQSVLSQTVMTIDRAIAEAAARHPSS